LNNKKTHERAQDGTLKGTREKANIGKYAMLCLNKLRYRRKRDSKGH